MSVTSAGYTDLAGNNGSGGSINEPENTVSATGPSFVSENIISGNSGKRS